MNEVYEFDVLVVNLVVEELSVLRLKLREITTIIGLKAHLHRAIVTTPLELHFFKLYEIYYYLPKITLTLC